MKLGALAALVGSVVAQDFALYGYGTLGGGMYTFNLVWRILISIVAWVGTTGGAGGTVTNVTTRDALIAAVKVRID